MRNTARALNVLGLAGAMLIGGWGGAGAQAQTTAGSSLHENGTVPPDPTGSGTISGTVLDPQGAVIEGASLVLVRQDSSEQRKAQSGDDGQFRFAGLPAGTYTLTASGSGMSTFTSQPIPLRGGEVHIVPPFVLSVAEATSSVTVTADKEQLAEEQVQIAVEQRVFKVFPNFYSSYDWNAPPMMAKQKMKLGLRSVFDPVSFAAVAAVAGAEQVQNTFPSYGGGIEGYGKRYGAAFATHASADLLSRAAFPALFHQDPRYFYKGQGSTTSRAMYAMSAAVMARNDDGKWRPNYSNVLGNFAAAGLSNLYYPEADRGVSLAFLNGLANTGADMATNLIREFVLKGITSHAGGKP